ncbi:NfeD family protein [Marinospirillum sp. MEB164]|uniref:NfeD family protein n=1 Tax=Marinospirillum alkalitolerans TaxID=3123374 RepID=A0ABW8PYB2_9GAMM
MTPIAWIVFGLFLILTELLATSIVAVFLGLGALITGLLLHLGWIESSAMQMLVFGSSSLALLLIARKKLKRYFVGETRSEKKNTLHFQQEIGQRVTVVTDFQQGSGRVSLNGVHWHGLSDEDLKAGEVAWVVRNQGIELYLSRTPPSSPDQGRSHEK